MCNNYFKLSMLNKFKFFSSLSRCHWSVANIINNSYWLFQLIERLLLSLPFDKYKLSSNPTLGFPPIKTV